MSHHECPVVRVTRVEHHENADRLSVVYFRGFGVVSAKLEDGSHRYAPGDLVVYCPADSLLPEWLLRDSGFWDEEQGRGTLDGRLGNRVRPRRLRGFLSEGIMLPVRRAVCGDVLLYTVATSSGVCILGEGPGLTPEDVEARSLDMACQLGIGKYVPEIPSSMGGVVWNVSDIPKFDVENIKKYPDVLAPDEEVVATEKLHGTMLGVGYQSQLADHPDTLGGVYAFSKGLGGRGLVFRMTEENASNVYVRAARELADGVRRLGWDRGTSLHVYLELLGPGIQDLHYGLRRPEVRLIDVRLGRDGDDLAGGGWLDWDSAESVAAALGVGTVPVLYRGPASGYDRSVALGQTTLGGGGVREGAVIKTVLPRNDPGLGRVILKDINEKYLTRRGGTEYQ